MTAKTTANGSLIRFRSYSHDAANRLTSDGQKEYEYNEDGNLIRAIAGDYAVQYDYTPSGVLSKVKYPDGSYVAYEYDAFGRKTTRTESFYKENPDFIPPGQLKDSESNGNGNGNSFKNSNSHGSSNGQVNGNANGQGNGNANGQDNANGNGNGNSNDQGNGNAYGHGNGNAYGHGNGNGPLRLETDTTRYLYDGSGVNVLNEYAGNGAPLGEYYYAGSSIVSKKMFGNHGLDGRGPDLHTTGGAHVLPV